jgi:hypothetical protein
MVEVEEARCVAAAGVLVEAEEVSFSFFDTDVEEEYFLEVDAL